MADYRPQYTVQPVSKYNAQIGKPHASYDAVKTLCGQVITDKFVILSSDHTGVPTCKACLQQLGKNLIG